MIGIGENINDNWCGQALNEVIHIFDDILWHLYAPLKDIIHNDIVVPPDDLLRLCPIVSQVAASTIVNQQWFDNLIWKSLANGMMLLKDAFKFCSKSVDCAWGSQI